MILYRTNWITDKTDKDGFCALRLRVKWSKSKCMATFALPFKVDAAKWIQSAQRLKPNTTHGKYKVSASDINARMADYEQYVKEIFGAFTDTIPTVDYVRREFDAKAGNPTRNDNLVSELLDTYIGEQSEQCQWTRATITKFTTLKTHLSNYNSKLTMPDVNDASMQGFVRYMVDKGYRNSYVSKIYDLTKCFIKWAAGKELYHGNVLQSYKPRLKGAENKHAIVYLTWDELQTLLNFPFKFNYLSQVRDVFCFCAFTGLRYSDVEKLKRRDIKDGYIEVVTKKTFDSLRIELNDYSRAILERYKDAPLPDGKALPVISNAKYNLYLKEVGKIAELDENVKQVYYVGSQRHERDVPKWQVLTTHAARRSFVVNALYLGISPSVIMEWTGHSNYEAMKPYIAIVDNLKKSEMAKFNRH